MKRILAMLAVAAILGLAGAAALVWQQYDELRHAALISPDADAEIIEVPPGSSLRATAKELARRGYLDSPWPLRLYSRYTGDAGRIQAGEYRIEPGMTAVALLGRMRRGEVVQHRLTIVEGWSVDDLLGAVASHEALEQTLPPDDPAALMEALGHPERHPEGRFLPETYRFPRGTTDVALLRRAYRAMEQALIEEWEERAEGLPLDSPEEALILASIIEKETGRADERRRIAGVFTRRLERGMRLQTDPTVIYGLGDAFDGDLRRVDLRTDTPYNTYIRDGLPPTPIALPGRASLHAAVHPEEGSALYFVADGRGGHVFSDTLEAHNRAVREYQLDGSRGEP
ncbi:endolytic transglycosylase MltG [Arhodomonas sp. SL1]|uniref:endolytic transglycosylase MltG n=1 Tax=Arhodomonas sp. SL1 TaxID=3425691 RepID=UPI003F8849F8